MPEGSTPFRDAEAWLAERGVPREPVTRPDGPEPEPPSAAPERDPGPERDPVPERDPRAAPEEDAGAAGSPPVGEREAARLAGQVRADRAVAEAERAAVPRSRGGLEDDVARAVAFVRRSTAGTPQAQGRLASKLAARGFAPEVVHLAMERARRERLVDDEAMVASLVEERRRAGHAPGRIRRDLAARGFTEETLAPALAPVEAEDQEAAAFAVAAERARRLTAVDTDAAFRRVVAYVARRGYPEGLARKVARAAVFSTRDDERNAGR